METAAVRVEQQRDGATVRVDGAVTPALVQDLRRVSARFRFVRCDLRTAHLSAEGANALRAWHAAARDALELLLPDAVVPVAAADRPAGPGAPVDILDLLAHEMRGPLSVAHLRLQTQAARLAARGLADEAAAARTAMGGLDAVTRLFETYRTASRPWTLRAVSLPALAADAAGQARDQVGHGTVDVRVSPPETDVWVRGEQQALLQLIWNLVRNGLEAAGPEARVRIDIAAPQDAGPVDAIICDNGPGFPPDVLAAPFRTRASRKDGGMGIGLILCNWIVERHQGRMRLRNGPAGAEVHLEMPTAPPEP